MEILSEFQEQDHTSFTPLRASGYHQYLLFSFSWPPFFLFSSHVLLVLGDLSGPGASPSPLEAFLKPQHQHMVPHSSSLIVTEDVVPASESSFSYSSPGWNISMTSCYTTFSLALGQHIDVFVSGKLLRYHIVNSTLMTSSPNSLLGHLPREGETKGQHVPLSKLRLPP